MTRMLPRAGKNTQPSSSLSDLDTFEPYLSQWALAQDGDPIFTERSHLLPVLYRGKSAMLKIAVEPEERLGDMVGWRRCSPRLCA